MTAVEPEEVRRPCGRRRARSRGSTISGAVTPRVRAACSRAVSTASRQLSVPPLVKVPAVPGPPPSSRGGLPDDVVLQRDDAGEGGHVQAVDAGEGGVRAGGQLVEARRARVVDVRHGAAAAHRQVGGPQRAEPGEDALSSPSRVARRFGLMRAESRPRPAARTRPEAEYCSPSAVGPGQAVRRAGARPGRPCSAAGSA